MDLASTSQAKNFRVIVMDDDREIRKFSSLYLNKSGLSNEQIIELANPAHLNKFLKEEEKNRDSLRNLCVLSDTDMNIDDYTATSISAPSEEDKAGISLDFLGCQKVLRQFSDRFNFYLINRSARVDTDKQNSKDDLSKKGSIEDPIMLAKSSDVKGFKDFLQALITYCSSEDGPF